MLSPGEQETYQRQGTRDSRGLWQYCYQEKNTRIYQKKTEIKFEEMELVGFRDKDDGAIRNAYDKDDEIPTIKDNMKKRIKEIKGVALGLCQWKDEHLWYQEKIWIPNNEGVRTNLIRRCHDDPLEEHEGTAETTERVSRQYYWPRMREMIKRCVKNYDMYQRGEVVRHVPYGMLQSNQVPDQPWKSIVVDFIIDLPNSEGYDKILVVINRLTKMSHCIPCR